MSAGEPGVAEQGEAEGAGGRGWADTYLAYLVLLVTLLLRSQSRLVGQAASSAVTRRAAEGPRTGSRRTPMAAEADVPPAVAAGDGDAPAGGGGQPVRERKTKSKTKTAEECAAFDYFS